ncbi:hypothetical protein VC83_00701 [Pseudogymnoascus destructans]|uniref:C2H2-type domain-containing protein n=2 Tax=Pseudogymnoascus destructans TaxID=655981 RepID=L8GAS8_PSED2|nr:uncharacterized protein VC83_00701 [Pseudogymnoascus destructans]ELR10172.1 hypothetical protein GMDG_04566 [Pseudogymnoascus destructans 20631-21]OAF62714.1 hypothetical protein VC83_00701 [Pseudogymnoascus destructans]
MDCIDAANLDKSNRDMGSLVSRQESPQNPKRLASRENPRASKRQRIGIVGLDLAKKLKESKLAQKDHPAPDRLEEPHSLAITFSGILDKYGDKHESLIPRRLDGVPVKARCSMQIYHPTSECQNGTLTDIHEELLHISQEGEIRTAWNPATGHPETEINLPRSFVVPIRELYVPKPPAEKLKGPSVDSPSEISDSEDDSDEPLDEGEYGLAEKYFCHVSFSTVRIGPWPPLGLDCEISQGSPIGKQLRHGISNKRDLKMVTKTELLPLESLSMKMPLKIKLGPDRQTTQYQLALDAKWETPEVTQPESKKLQTSSKPNFVWKIELGDQTPAYVPSESRMNDYSCGICLAKLRSVKALQHHLRASHTQFKFTLTKSTSDKKDFVITVSHGESTILPKVDIQIRCNSPVSVGSPVNNATSVGTDAQVNKAPTTLSQVNTPVSVGSPVNNAPSVDPDATVNKVPEVAIMRSIFDFEDDLSSSDSIATNPLPTPKPPFAQNLSNPRQLPARDPSISASVSEPQSKTSSPNTTPDAVSDSDEPIEPRKRTRVQNSRSVIVDEDDDDGTPKLVVPKTAKPLYDIATKRMLKPGEPLPPSTVCHDWRIRKQEELINNISDMTPAEKEFINRWDPFIFGQKSTSKIFMPEILKEFIKVNRQWFDEEQCRKKELLKHLTTLKMSGRIEDECLWECLEMFQTERISPRKARQASKLSAIAREERALIEPWDRYVKDSKPKSLEKFLRVSKTLRSGRSAHVSNGEPVAMLRLFLGYYGRTSRRDIPALDNIFYKSNLPLPTTEAESEYVRFFNGFEKDFKAAPDETKSLEQLMLSFIGDNTAWFFEEIQRFQWAKKHLQELQWTEKITLKIRENILTYLETMESAYLSDEDMPDAAVADNLSSGSQTDPHNKGKGKEAAAHVKRASAPFVITPDPLNPPRPRNVRALGECECGGYAMPGGSVMCAAEYCIARTFHRRCVPDPPPRGKPWYCRDCAAEGLGLNVETQLDRMDLSA